MVNTTEKEPEIASPPDEPESKASAFEILGLNSLAEFLKSGRANGNENQADS